MVSPRNLKVKLKHYRYSRLNSMSIEMGGDRGIYPRVHTGKSRHTNGGKRPISYTEFRMMKFLFSNHIVYQKLVEHCRHKREMLKKRSDSLTRLSQYRFEVLFQNCVIVGAHFTKLDAHSGRAFDIYLRFSYPHHFTLDVQRVWDAWQRQFE